MKDKIKELANAIAEEIRGRYPNQPVKGEIESQRAKIYFLKGAKAVMALAEYKDIKMPTS